MRTQNMLETRPWNYYKPTDKNWLDNNVIKHADFSIIVKSV